MSDANILRDVVNTGLERWGGTLAPGERAAAGPAIDRGVSRVSLPGVLALLALGQRGDPTATGPQQGLDDATIRRLLGHVGGLAGSPVTPGEAAEALALLGSGDFFEDVSAGLGAVLRLAHRAPRSLVRDVIRLPQLPSALVTAVRADRGDLDGGAIQGVLARLGGATAGPQEGPLDHTLRALLGLATLRTAVETLRDLLAPDNRTLRLAIMVYLRSLGYGSFGEPDLDALVRALDPDHPDLGPLVDAGLAHLHRRAGSARGAMELLASMGIR
jgi:hypothetical protein